MTETQDLNFKPEHQITRKNVTQSLMGTMSHHL